MKKVHLIGNSHLDPVWLWTWQEGFAEIKATFRSALDRMREFDDFTFTSACASYYMWIEKSDPSMFLEIQERVKEGRWCVVGGWFLQPDCNIPSGESFARHALISQRYFERVFGKMAEIGYNVDSFGHNGSIPQLLRLSRMKSYVFMRPQEHEKRLDQNLFVWESADGSRVTAYRIPFYYNLDERKFECFEKIRALGGSCDEMAFYGVGNHGGGATVSLLNKMHDELSDDFVYSTPTAFFASQEGKKLPVVTGDLQYHAKGCYSAQSEVKQNNRICENLLLNAEAYAVLAHKLLGTPYPKEELTRAWHGTLFNQFHDILGGCCIPEAFEDARRMHGEVKAIGDRNVNFSTQQISWNVDTIGEHEVGSSISPEQANEIGLPVVVFNPNDHEVCGDVYLRFAYHSQQNYDRITDDRGNELALQRVRDSKTNQDRKYAKLFEARVPALGYAVYRLFQKPSTVDVNPFEVCADGMQNDLLRVRFDLQTGELCSLYDRKNGKELLSAPSSIRLFDDEAYDTWAHNVSTYDKEVPVSLTSVSVKAIEQGPVRATFRVEQCFGDSRIRRDYALNASSGVLLVKTKLDFHEKFRIFKLRYPVHTQTQKAYCKIPFGSIERPCDQTEQVCGDWICLGSKGDGLCIANDSKHSFDANGNQLSMTVLRSALFADHYAGEEFRDEFCEFMEQGEHVFAYTLSPFESFAQNDRTAKELQAPLWAVRETFHKGPLPTSANGIYLSAPNVVVSAVKQQEDQKGYVVRLCEMDGTDTDLTVRLFDCEARLHVPHNSVKTLWFDGERVLETDFIEAL